MKKIFALLLCVFITVAVFAASQTMTYYVDTEQKYVFSVDNLSQTIPEFVEDTAKQDAMANKYLELANKETGAVSVKDLFEICEAGGFKTRRAEGYESCRNFVIKLLETVEQELEDGTLTGYCPGLDENGKNPNRLKSITGETQVGDFCSSSNIAAGEVVFKKGYNCTCAASACNSCCESIGGACLTKVADGNGNCLRKVYDNVQNLNAEGAALKFCESKAQRGCKVINAIKNFNSVKGKVVCNATQAEFDTVVALNTPCPDTAYALTSNNNTKEKCHSFCQAQTKAAGCKLARSLYRPSTKECVCNPDTETVRRLNMKYYQVCGKDNGKTGSQEICKDDLFTDKVGGTQVSLNIGIALAKEWARVNKYREIECDTKIYDYSALDDSILCSSIDPDRNGKRAYFEFVFDDLKESKDMTLNNSFYDAVFTRIYGYNKVSSLKEYMAWDTKSESNCNKVNDSLKKMCGRGCSVIWGHNGNKYCYLDLYTNLPTSERTAKTGPDDFDNPFNIDPFMFCKGAQTQLQNTSSLDVLLKQTISNASNYPMSKIECFAKTTKYCGGGCKCDEISLDPGDDIKECVVHGDKDYYVDFVFDDITEFSKKREKGALQSMGCVVNGGTFNGQECKFANKSQCDTYIKSMSKVCPQCTKPKWNPDTGLCEVPDAAAVTAMEKHEKTAMIVGGVVVSVVVTVATAGSGAPAIAFVLSGIEVAGGAMEYFAQQHIDGMAHDFFLKSAKCNNASCATKMLYEDLQEMANIQNDLEDYEINALDAEFERLLGLIDPGSDFYMAIVDKGITLQDNQKGFFDPESWNQAQVWRAIGIGLQFLSLGTGPITKIISSARFGSKFPKMQAMLLKQVKITKQIRDAKKVVNTVDKTADAARNMDASQAKKLEELNNDIAKIESKANRTPEEAEKLKKLRQERNTLMNKVGTKDADELAKMQKEAFNQKDIQKAREDYDKIMERRNYVAKYMAEHNGNPPSGVSKQAVREINENVSKAENKLKELGQEVNPMEPLQIGKKPTVEPVEGADAGKAADKADNVADAGKGVNKAQNSNISSIEEIENSLGSNYKNLKRELKTNPDKTLVFDKNNLTDEEWKILNESLAKENLEVVSSGESMFVRQKRVFPDAISDIRNRAYSEFNAHADNIKKGVEKELNIPKSHLSNDEWKALEADLNKEGLEITEANDHYFRVKKSTKANPVSNVVNKVDNVASSTKSGNKVDEVVNAGRAATKSKTEKIAEARVRGDLGYHGTDADIAMDDMIRSSANSSDQLGGVGYGIARDYDAAEKYAVKRLIERQNVGKNIKFSHQFQGDVLVVDCDEALNLSNKTGYVYTTAKNSDIKWDALQNGYVGVFDAAQMPNSVEILDKTAFNLDDLVRQGKVKINIKSAANKIDNVASGASKASTNVSSGKKMYSPALVDGNLYRPTTIPEQSESVWELTEVAPNKYQITVYKDAEKKILANPAFLEGANKQVMGFDRVELIEPGIAEMDAATGKLRVTKVPEVWLVENASTAAKTVNKVDNVADASKTVKPTKTVGKWANATVPDPAFDIKVTPLELGGKKYYLKSGDTESLIQNEISRTKQAHELLKHNKIVTSVDVVEDDQTVLKAFMDDHPEITLPRTPDTQYFIMDATHVNTVEELSDAEILGYLRNKPITIEEQNTILSELQNMNNNGLIHNDIWHNFAIYRDSGGKLHMELMDFGDFTSAQKLSRSNDDVLEIKKLFSKWSDKGLVEKTATPKVTANTASKTAGKANDVAKVSASEAKAANVATLRQSASKSFDKYLAEVKTSPTGKGAKLPKSRLNDAGWNTVNESLARDNVQLIDTGDGYMQFVRADHIDEAEIIGVEVVDASKGVKPTKTAGNVVLDENELVRFKGNGGKVVNKDYIQASKDARNFMNNAIESGEYTKSVDSYIESINDMHKVSANGANGNLNWYADAGQGSLNVNPGKIRGKIGRLSNGRVEEASRVEQIARKYGDPFSITKNSKVELPGIPRNNLPEDKIVDGHFRHVYPDGGDALRPYYEQMYRTSKEALELIDNQASERAILEKIAEHYQYAANARPYGQINNSLFMNEANTLLQKAGLRTMPHGELDHAAMHLQPDAFKRYFVDTYYATKL